MDDNFKLPQEVRLKYIERRKTDIHECLAALHRCDFSHLARVGHQLKGNASSFGYDDLTDIAVEMEKYALEKNSVRLQDILEKFRRYVEQMR